MASINKSFNHQYKLSLQRSNVSSQTLLNNVWCTNKEILNSNIDNILDSASSLLESDTTNMKCWKSSLSKVDPVALMEKSLPTCPSCTGSERVGLKQFQRNYCGCDIGVADTQEMHIENKGNKRINSLFGRTVSSEGWSCYEDKSGNENKQLFKPKFGQSKNAGKNLIPPTKKISDEMEDVIEEDDEKVRKSKVAKITFKSAREQLLASNPAFKRSLGTSRKAQGKFVSPMMGAQTAKQGNSEQGISDESLKHIDPKMIELIESEIIDKGTPIAWDDIAGLQLAKSVIQEAVVWPLLRPDIFTGLRRPPKGILLFGPPGTGKTLIGKCVAAQCNATFFSISASSLTSKWIGDGEKMVRALFAVARCHQPAVIFIDEIDSLLTQRSDTEHEATRRIKTEFLVQFDGAATGEEDRLLIVGATNRPQELDEAARRRLVKRLYIPLPDEDARQLIISNLLQSENHELSPGDMAEIARRTEGYSGADMKSLCSEAAMGPIRAVPFSQIVTINRNEVRPVSLQDFLNAIQRVKPSVSQSDLGQYVEWNKTYGHGF